MEIKYTVEILSKDIQDIAKLVANLNNYNSPPRIELDLALSKLRNAYDLLYTISNDTQQATVSPKAEPTPQAIPQPTPQPIPQPTPQPTPQPEPRTEPQTEPEPLNEEPEQVKNIQQVANEATPEVSAPASTTEILADTFKQDASINEKILAADTNQPPTVQGEAIDSIKRNIGINDRFLIIRELLNGDNEEFNVLVQNLDTCTHFNQAFQLLESKFPNQLKHEGVQVLINLARRRHISKGNV